MGKMARYYDKNGREILEGMTIRHDGGETEKIYRCNNDLGVNASNASYYGDDEPHEIYPLHQFATKLEWEIVD